MSLEVKLKEVDKLCTGCEQKLVIFLDRKFDGRFWCLTKTCNQIWFPATKQQVRQINKMLKEGKIIPSDKEIKASSSSSNNDEEIK